MSPRKKRVTGFEDMAVLWTPTTPQELWRALVRYSGQRDPYHGEAVQLLRRHHGDGTSEALTTARLLCTDRRWDRCTHRLIHAIEETGILSDEELDELAHGFLARKHFTYRYPVSWIGTEWRAVAIGDGDAVDEQSIERLDPETPVASVRYIAPPLRRWAAERLLRGEPRNFDKLQALAFKHGTRDGDAIVSGMIDAVRAAHPKLAPQAIELGLGWPRGSVRLLALDLLAMTDPEAARRRAATDPDKKVRQWDPDQVDGRSSKRAAAQTELFPE